MEHYHISGVPITEPDGKLVGILTNRDLRFIDNIDQPIGGVMTKDNLITAPVGTTLDEAATSCTATGSRSCRWSTRTAT